MRLCLILIALFGLSSCGTSKSQLTSGGEKVRVLYKKQRGCHVLAKVVGENDQGSVDLAKNHARNLAATKGADSITFNQIVSNGKEYRVHATALRCRS